MNIIISDRLRKTRHIFIAAMFLNAAVYAQSADLKFVNYQNIPGLENRNSLVRDSSGYIWICGNGVARFDGTQLKRYQKDERHSYSLRTNNVNNLTTDKNGTMWMAAGGLCYYDPALDGFIYPGNNPGKKDAYDEGLVYDGMETIWFSGDSGLCRININTKKITPASLKNYSYPNKLIMDNAGKIWLADSYNDLYVYDPQTDKYKKFLLSDMGTYGPVRSFFCDKQNKIWLATAKGIMKADPEGFTDAKGKFKFQAAEELRDVTVAGGTSAFSYLPSYGGDSILWIATYTNGLITYNLNTKKIDAAFLPDKGNPNSIAAKTSYALYRDRDDHLWILYAAGISMLNLNNQNFKTRILTEPDDETILNIGTMEPDKNEKNVVWIGGSKGLIKYDWNNKKPLQRISSFEPGIAYNSADNIADDGTGNLWISSGNTLYKYVKRSERFIKCPPLPTNKLFSYVSYITKIICLHDTVLIGSTTGLSVFFPAQNQYRVLYTGKDTGPDNNSFNIFSLKRDDEGTVWCVGAKGLIKVDLINGMHKLYTFNDPLNFRGFNRFTGIDFDANNIVIAASAGAVIFNKTTKQFKKLSRNGDAALDNSWDVRVDGRKNYWITTYFGLVFYNTKTNLYKVYTAADGLPQTFTGLPIDLIDNNLVTKYRGAFVYIVPYTADDNSNIPQPVIEAFKIFEKPVVLNLTEAANKPVNLSYKQNFFSFDFNAFEFNYPDKIEFAYRLTGFNNDWVSVGSKRNAGFTNVPPGNYTFEMKAANSRGLWSKPALFKIYIKPAFWQTLWFKILAAALFFGLILFMVKRQITKIEKDAERKTETAKLLADSEMKALRAQMNPHFIFNSLNSIQKYIWENKQDDASEYLTKFAKLIRIVLENSGAKLITLQNELTALKLYTELEHRRSNHKFDYRITLDENLLAEHILIPPLLLQPYIENAIWHGLNAKKEHGNLQITIVAKEEYLICTIDDNGIGRKACLQKTPASHKSMGLNISDQRMKLLERETNIKAHAEVIDKTDENNMPAGTTVIVTLPLILLYA